jgi:hypothetical protein
MVWWLNRLIVDLFNRFIVELFHRQMESAFEFDCPSPDSRGKPFAVVFSLSFCWTCVPQKFGNGWREKAPSKN